MQCRNKRLFSLLPVHCVLVIALFLCGICYEEIPTYSFFACEYSDNSFFDTSSEIRSANTISFSEDFHCEELIREAFPSSLMNQAFKRIANKAGRAVSLDLLMVELFPQYFYLSHNQNMDIIPDLVHSHTILIHYIHRKDGKKSALAISC